MMFSPPEQVHDHKTVIICFLDMMYFNCHKKHSYLGINDLMYNVEYLEKERNNKTINNKKKHLKISCHKWHHSFCYCQVDSPNMYLIYMKNFKNHFFVIQTAVRMWFWPNDAENFKEFCCKSNLLQPAGYVLYHYLSICFNEFSHFELCNSIYLSNFLIFFSSLLFLWHSQDLKCQNKKNLSFFVWFNF